MSAIKARCERCGWNLLNIVRDRENRRILERPGLRYALERIADREADGLVVSDLRRLSGSLVDLGALMAWFREAHATLIALDLGVDTSTPEAENVAATLAALGAHEHERIARRTRALAGDAQAHGRPAVSHRPELMERIASMRATNITLQAIADQLNAENVPTLRGGTKWRPSSIQAALGYRRPGPRDHLPPLKRSRRDRTTCLRSHGRPSARVNPRATHPRMPTGGHRNGGRSRLLVLAGLDASAAGGSLGPVELPARTSTTTPGHRHLGNASLSLEGVAGSRRECRLRNGLERIGLSSSTQD